MSFEEVDKALRVPRTIYAPDGTRFMLLVKVNEDATSVGQLFRPDFVRYELTGPNEQAHVWIFNHLLELDPDPYHEDVLRPGPSRWRSPSPDGVNSPKKRCLEKGVNRRVELYDLFTSCVWAIRIPTLR